MSRVTDTDLRAPVVRAYAQGSPGYLIATCVVAPLTILAAVNATSSLGPAQSILAGLGALILCVTAVVAPYLVLAAGMAGLPWIASFATPIGSATFGEALIALGGIAVLASERALARSWAHARLIALFAAPYFLVAALLALGGVGLWSTILQRLVIIAIGVLGGLGLWKVDERRRVLALRAFLVSASLLALTWIAAWGSPSVAGINKNPGGQMLASAVILGVVLGSRRLDMAMALLCGLGVAATGSRGSLVGLAAGMLVLFFLSRKARRLIAGIIVFVALATLTAATISPSYIDGLVREFTSTHTLDQRALLQSYALEAWHAVPSGHGVGAFIVPIPELAWLQTNDPHNVAVLTLFEGGILLLAAFALFALGPSLVLLFRKWRARSWLPSAAIAVVVATLAHSFFDVFWVRSTPTLGLILVVAAMADVSIDRSEGRP